MMHMLIIGGSDAGISAALRIRELDAGAVVAVLLADNYPNFSICGLPFYLSGEVADWRALAHRTAEEIEKQGIRLMPGRRALAVDPTARRVHGVEADGNTFLIGYDKLLIATGAESAAPPIEGLDHSGVFFLRWMDDAFAVKRFMDQESPVQAVIIGGGSLALKWSAIMNLRFPSA